MGRYVNGLELEVAWTELGQSLVSSSVQLLSRYRFFVTPWTAAHQASLSISNSRSLLRFTSVKSVMPSSHLALRHPVEPDGRGQVGGRQSATAGRFHTKSCRVMAMLFAACPTQPHATPRQRQGRPGPQTQDSLSVSSARPSVAGRRGNRGHRQLSRPSPYPQPQPRGHLRHGSGGPHCGPVPLAGRAALTVCSPSSAPPAPPQANPALRL